MIAEKLLHEKVSMLGCQLLAVLTLHNCTVFVKRVRGELKQVSERVQHQLGFPFNGKIRLVLDRILISLKQMRLELHIWLTFHPCKSLVAPTLVNRENKKDWAVRTLKSVV